MSSFSIFYFNRCTVYILLYNRVKSHSRFRLITLKNCCYLSEYIRFTYYMLYARNLRETRIYTNTALE